MPDKNHGAPTDTQGDAFGGGDRGHLPTEQRNPASQGLDALSVEATLRLINQEDQSVPRAVERAIPSLNALTEAALNGMHAGGRLIYVGAGTSGRLGVLDASEIPPTFFEAPGKVVGVIAGGDGALRQSSEGKEDERDGAHPALKALSLTSADTVIGIAAGGTTPYVHGAIDFANAQGCVSALLLCVPFADLRMQQPSAPDHVIELRTGPEVVTGSTRMKAGTATKLALNMLSTTLMAQRGKVWGNLMVDVRATNTKLRGRAVRLIGKQCALNPKASRNLLEQAQGRVKHALVMHHQQVDFQEAAKLLEQHQDKLSRIIGRPTD